MDLGTSQGGQIILILLLGKNNRTRNERLDCYSRKFIVVKFVVNQIRIMQTFFQRYTNGNCWMGCGHSTINLIDTSGGMRDNQVDFIRNIIKRKNVNCGRFISSSEMVLNHYVELYDEKKENMAKLFRKPAFM